jgi:hypothetical protein
MALGLDKAEILSLTIEAALWGMTGQRFGWVMIAELALCRHRFFVDDVWGDGVPYVPFALA